MTLPPFLHRFLFQRVSARGFVRMRTVWAALTFGVFLAQWQDVSLYYGGEIVPLYLLLLATLLCVFFNVQTRPALIGTFLLFTFFLQRNPLPFGGGELLLHHIGFLLMVTPIKRCQVSGVRFQEETMSVWPYRLLLFQIIILYVSSAWQKLLGETWFDGSALAMALAHPHFARFPGLFAGVPVGFLSLLGKTIVAWELSWFLLLLPRQRFLKSMLLLSGIFFHLVIFLFLKVGVFSAAMLTAYLGLLGEVLPTAKSRASSA